MKKNIYCVEFRQGLLSYTRQQWTSFEEAAGHYKPTSSVVVSGWPFKTVHLVCGDAEHGCGIAVFGE